MMIRTGSTNSIINSSSSTITATSGYLSFVKFITEDVWKFNNHKLRKFVAGATRVKNKLLTILLLSISVPIKLFKFIFDALKVIYSALTSKVFLFSSFQVLFVFMILYLGCMFFFDQPTIQHKDQPYIPIDGDSQWYSLPVERCHLTVVFSCGPRVKNVGHEYDHIKNNLESFTQSKQRLFNPCIVIFNLDVDHREKLKNLVDDFSKNHEAVVDVINYPGKAGNAQSKSQLFYEMLNTFKLSYMVDDTDNIDESVKRVISSSDSPILFMDESATFCLHGISHLSLVFEHMEHLKEKGSDWKTYHLSQGMSGTIIQRKDIVSTIDYFEKRIDSPHSLKYLLDNFILENNAEQSQENRLSYRYRFQLISLGRTQKTQCFETQYDFEVEQCANALFYPCTASLKTKFVEEEKKMNEFQHNTLMLPSFPPTFKNGISDFKNVESVLCELGENCDKCCSKLGGVCDVNFFEYINRCDEFEKFTKNCKCGYDKGSQTNTQPAVRHGHCNLGFRASSFNCNNSDGSSRRLCPCRKYKN